MTKQEYINGMLELEMAYTNFEITKDKAKANYWYNYFSNIDNFTFIKAVRTYIVRNQYKPTISTLLDTIIELAINEKPSSASESWNNSLKLINGKNLNKAELEKQLDSVSYKAISSVGLLRIKNSLERELPFLYNEYKKEFETIQRNDTIEQVKNGLISLKQGEGKIMINE